MTRRPLAVAGLALLLALVAPAARSGGDPPAARSGEDLELLMFDDDACAYCVRWHEEIGVIYAKTEEGRSAPLRSIAHESPIPPDIELAAPLRVTPTFVLLAHGRELGRITGYPGEEFFFGMLAELIARTR